MQYCKAIILKKKVYEKTRDNTVSFLGKFCSEFWTENVLSSYKM